MTVLMLVTFFVVLAVAVPAMADRDARSHRLGRYGRIRHHRTPTHAS